MDLLNNKWLTTGLCSYEIVAIVSKHFTGKDTIPTLTTLSRRHKWVGPALTTAMTWHFWKAGK